jgi:hypothetical protein
MHILTRAAAWAFAAGLTGPLTVVLIPAVWHAVSSSHSTFEFFGTLLGGYIIGAATGAVVALVLGSPSYLLLLLLWPIVVDWFPRLELVRRQFLLAMLVLALPAGFVGYVVSRNGGPSPIGVAPNALSFAAVCFVTAWTGLCIPRLILGFLRLGAFVFPGSQSFPGDQS